ncbi:MAG: hypothetical protein QOH21_2162 [Acidobacteriota bacterium]|nr:hypothetical protein [Acidobacteriota bacterium]
MLSLLALVTASVRTHADITLQRNGFALLRPQTPASVPLDDDALSVQLQLGLDWRPFAGFGTHLHLLARNDGDESRRGHVGVVEAYAEKNLNVGDDRVRIVAGAFFLPTSRENIDSLWETPYTLTASALNSWLGEEFRPIGVDVAYRHRTAASGTFTGGATLFGGNDTFGEILIGRGWAMHDRWTLLGEHVPTRPNHYTSISAETDHRLGWSARAKWNNDAGSIQLTRIDNRSDALQYGELFNWATRFNLAGADYTWGDWTVAGEGGWGTTAIVTARGRFSSEIAAGYVLVSRRVKKFRVTLRADEYQVRDDRENALTAALLWEARPRLRASIEGITAEGEKRMAVELRYRF